MGAPRLGATVVVAAALLLLLFVLVRWWNLCQHPTQRGALRWMLGGGGAATSIARPLKNVDGSPSDTVVVRILSYNTMLLPPPAAPRVMERARAIGKALNLAMNGADGGRGAPVVDVCALQEAVYPPAVDALLQAAALPFSVSPLVAGMFRMNGGCSIGARAAPIGVRHHVFKAQKAGFSFDSLIAKGCAAATFQLSPRRTLTVVNTHLQSPVEQQELREQQITELHAFISEGCYDPERDIVVLTGDWNLETRDPALFQLVRAQPIEWSALTPPDKRASWDVWAAGGPKDLLDVAAVHADYGAGVVRARTTLVDVGSPSLSDHRGILLSLTVQLR
jgi:endonuclease/exonuclease/phosphatase family metal-dependent hydrolase